MLRVILGHQLKLQKTGGVDGALQSPVGAAGISRFSNDRPHHAGPGSDRATVDLSNTASGHIRVAAWRMVGGFLQPPGSSNTAYARWFASENPRITFGTR